MKFTLVACLCTVVLAACNGPDRLPYHDYQLYRNATIDIEPLIEVGHATLVSVTEGESIVLVIWDGFYRGRYSTAHSSHDAFFIQIPLETRAGDVVHCSSMDGSLAYDAFEGYGFKYLDPASPANATIEVLEISESQLRAIVELRAAVLREWSDVPEAVSFRKQYRFDLKPVSTQSAG